MTKELDALKQDVADVATAVAHTVNVLDDLAAKVAAGGAVLPSDLTALSAVLKAGSAALAAATLKDDPTA